LPSKLIYIQTERQTGLLAGRQTERHSDRPDWHCHKHGRKKGEQASRLSLRQIETISLLSQRLIPKRRDGAGEQIQKLYTVV